MKSASCHLIPALILLFLSSAHQDAQAQSVDLIGKVTAEEILQHDKIYKIYADRYEPDEDAIEYLKSYTDSVEVLIFFGSWCRESKKFIPGLIKTLKIFQPESIEAQYVGVSKDKNMPGGLLKMYEIEYIPTVVVLKGPKELGRIIEKPLQSIETDLVEILKTVTGKK